MIRNARQRQHGRWLLLSLSLLWFLISAVEAQSITGLLAQVPSCSLPCLTQTITKGNCNLTSVATVSECLCPNVDLQSDLSTCVQLSCNFKDQISAAELLGSLCAAYPKESRSQEVKTIAIALSVITFPAVALRCFSRWMITRRLWWDDWTAIFATILLAALAGIEIASADLGFGTHYWNVDPVSGEKLIKLFYAVQQIYILIQVFAKISILLFFSRIFPAKWFQLTVRYFIIFLLLHGLIFLLTITFQSIGYAGAVFSIVEDLVILVLPIPELYKLQLNIRKKIALGLMFSLGSFACITTMDNVDIVIWSIIEEFCAILCASLPALRPLLQKVPRLFTTNRTTTKTISTSPSKRSILHHNKDKFHEIPETPMGPELPSTPIAIEDEMAAQADGKRPVLITRGNEVDVRADVELQNVKRTKKKWQKNVNGRI